MPYDTGKQQVLAFDTSSKLQFNTLNGLNEAIEEAVNTILNYEKEMDQKIPENLNNQMNSYKIDQQQMNEENQDDRPYNEQENNDINNNQQNYKNMNYEINNDQQNYNMNNMNQKEIYMQIPNSKPLYDDDQMFNQPMHENNNANEQNEMTNQDDNNYNQNENQINNQNYMENNQNFMDNNQNYMNNNQNDYLYKTQSVNQYQNNPMTKINNLNVKEFSYSNKKKPILNHNQLNRNQKYVKKLICRNRRHNRAIRSRFHQSGSNNYANYYFKNGYSSFNSDFNGFNSIYSPNLIRYPVYVSDYDSDLINRLYSIGNVFI